MYSHKLERTKRSVCNACISPSLAYAGSEDIPGCLMVSISIYGLFERFCMGVLRKILILPTTPSLSNKNSFLQIVCTSFGVLIVFYFHTWFVWTILHGCSSENSSFAFPPLPSLPRKKVFFKTVCAGFKVFQVVLLLSNSIYGLFERLYIGHIFLE